MLTNNIGSFFPILVQRALIALAFVMVAEQIPRLHYRFQQVILLITHIFEHMSEHNPLIINYGNDTMVELDNLEEANNCLEPVTDKDNSNSSQTEKYEHKYLIKFRDFPNEYTKFNDDEIKEKNRLIDVYRKDYNENREAKLKLFNDCILRCEESLNKINQVRSGLAEHVIIHDILLEYIDYLDDDYYDNDSDSETYKMVKPYFTPSLEDINFVHKQISEKLEDAREEINQIEEKSCDDSEFEDKAINYILESRLNGLINNYVLEITPLGNVYMRYNLSKSSFEYFSNSTIPYRYLEPIGRKYVMTYWCKPIFVDLEEELKQAEKRYNENLEKDKENVKETPSGQKSVLTKLKEYNKKNDMASKIIPKNRQSSAFALPPQIQANLPSVNNKSEKLLLKNNANRYTWEGRLSDFCPLKKIDLKKVNKSLNMSWAEFKKLQDGK